MLKAYYRADMQDTAVFEFFVRKMPPDRSFFMAAGLEQVLCYLENLHFSDEDLTVAARQRPFRRIVNQSSCRFSIQRRC
ncbi:MAG: hypothetical protein U5P41_14140 [Gammaproteobacteria bacterium]|nr:hypothetical protein [Gammaproteobacteria bacterium]